MDQKSLLLLIFLNGSNYAHVEETGTSSNSDDDSSSNQVQDKTQRRSFANPQWQYDGMSIEPGRRQMDRSLETKLLEATPEPTTTITTTTERTTIDPPLDPRYRRIYNADELAIIQEYPFMAAVLVNDKLWCGAAVVAINKVITAAHCLQLQYNNRFFREYVKMLTVRVGSTNSTAGGVVYPVSEIFFHPNYKPQSLEFNFAVLKLGKNITAHKNDIHVEKIEYSLDKVIPVDRSVTFLGWGSVLGVDGVGGDVLLQKVELPVYDLADCQSVYGRDLVTRNNFCAGFISVKKNVCNHDAGGPAIMDGLLVGILSFSSKRCDEPDKPAVFSTVGVVSPWLENIDQAKQTRDAFLTSKKKKTTMKQKLH